MNDRINTFRLLIVLLCISVGTFFSANAQVFESEINDISGRLNGKKVTIDRVFARFDAFNPFYAFVLSLYVQEKKKDDFTSGTNGFTFYFKSTRRQRLNGLPWTQIYDKYIFFTKIDGDNVKSVSYNDNEKRNVHLSIDKIEKRTDGANIIVGTIDYKEDNNTFVKGPFRAVIRKY